MHSVDANLIAVQWGLLGVFGVVVGLLLAPADQFLREFLDSAEPSDHERAARWAASLKVTSLLVLLALVGLSVLGGRDAGLSLAGPYATGSWLLLTAVLAQAGFVVLVMLLVKPVPPLAALELGPAGDRRASPSGLRRSSIIRFYNHTRVELQIWWINFQGKQDPAPYITLPPNGNEAQSTFEGHRFLIATTAGLEIATVEAAANPGTVSIGPERLAIH
jgi:hypothetical protein